MSHLASILHSPWLDWIDVIPKILLSPLLSGTMLAALTWAARETEYAISMVMKILPGNLDVSSLDLALARTVLKIVLALGFVRLLNQLLNTMAHNSWRISKAKGWNWPKEIAVITGGSSGIGKDIADRLVAMKVRVAVMDVQEPPKSLLVEPLVRFYKTDVSSPESVAEASDAIRRELGHPTILINNAGITKPVPILKMTGPYLRRIFGVNCLANWYTVQQFLPRMIQLDKGHIVTVASIASFVALPTGADYAASKAGALAFHEALACELKHYYKSPGILTTVVHPNFVRTPLVAGFADQLEKSGVHMLTSDVVADKIIMQLQSRRGGQLIIPESASVVSGIRGWPTWVQEVFRDVLGRTYIVN